MPMLVLLVAMISVQIGAAIAKTLLVALGVPGTTALRLGLASIMVVAYWRPWRRVPSARAIPAILVYGAAMGCMNLAFYASLRRIPLGLAVAVEFTGPLAVALFGSRRRLDVVWVALATLGLLALLPLDANAAALDPAGLGYGLAAGVCWAVYIVSGKRAGAEFGGASTALGMLVGAMLVVPIGIAEAGGALLRTEYWPAAAGVALLSSALPYSLEMFALARLPTRSFGILMSFEPALGALAGFVLLGERLSTLQWAAISSIVIACVGSAATPAGAAPAVSVIAK
jgi:inner membrane transporter RhtA